MISTVVLVLSVLAYGLATYLLARGSTGGVRAALTRWEWLAGTGTQGVAFLLAFLARQDLPLLVVQPALTASVAVTVVLGAVLRRWRLGPRDAVALAAVVAGVAGLGFCASPGRSDVPSAAALGVLAAGLALSVGWAVRGVRGRRPTGVQAFGTGIVAGLAFAVVAVAARVLAADPWGLVRTPTGLVALALLGGGVVLGQVLFTASLSGGSVAGPTASSHVVETVLPALAGIVWLGDAVVPGRAPLAVACTALALAGSVLLTHHGAPPSPSPQTAAAPASS